MDTTKKLGDCYAEVPQTAEEAAAKATRRDLYIYAKLGVAQHTKAIEDIEAGRRKSVPGTLNDIEWRRHALSCALKHIEELEAEFSDDPDIEQDMMETDRFFAELAAALKEGKSMDKQAT